MLWIGIILVLVVAFVLMMGAEELEKDLNRHRNRRPGAKPADMDKVRENIKKIDDLDFK